MPSMKAGRPSKPSRLRESHTYGGGDGDAGAPDPPGSPGGIIGDDDSYAVPDIEMEIEEDGEEDELDVSDSTSDKPSKAGAGQKGKPGRTAEPSSESSPAPGPESNLAVSTKKGLPKFKIKGKTSVLNKKGRKRADDDGEDISDFNSDEDTEVSISTYKTARQLAVGSKRGSGLEDLQELGTVAEKKSKFDGLTESEIALRREENARRRKNQTDQRLEEEKQETINRLLNKQVSRSRNKLGDGSGDEGESPGPDSRGSLASVRARMPDPAHMFRYSSTSSGPRLSLPMPPSEDEDCTTDAYGLAWNGVFGQSAHEVEATPSI